MDTHVNKAVECPTSYLPNLRASTGLPGVQDLLALLARLKQDLIEQQLDQHERSYAHTWLTRIFGVCDDDTCLDEASTILALTDPNHELQKLDDPIHDYHFQTPYGSVDITIRETYMQDADATGFRTWSSAIHLAERMLSDPQRFINLDNFSGSEDGLRVLEIGSGTGLAGIAAFRALQASPLSNFNLTLSDRDAVTLETLKDNVSRNCLPLRDQQMVDVRCLDWDEPPQDLWNKFEVIIGADIVYEPAHVPLVYKVVEATLARATSSIFTLLVPNRPSHHKDLEALEERFSTTASNYDNKKLVIIRQEDIEISSKDKYPYPHRLYSIGWR